GAAAVICVGEEHTNPHHHWAQLHILDELGRERSGASMALGMEMFQRPFQGVLDDYAAGRIDERALRERTGWAERWGYDFALYRPMVAMAAERGMSILALNISKELRKRVARQGLEGLGEAERAELPELDLDDARHRAWFDELMAEIGGHGSEAGDEDGPEAAARAQRIYTVQVLWGETMAETAARWVVAARGRQVIILAGNGHCHDSAIVGRVRRRGVDQVVSVRPVIDGNGGGGRVA